MAKIKKEKSGPIKTKQVAINSADYSQTLADIKKQISEAQIKAVFAVNKELIMLYWYIGKVIVEKQRKCKWGAKIIDQLAKDLQNSFPGLSGFSRANVFSMRGFYLAYEKVQQAVGQFENMPIFSIPWGHNVILIQKLKNDAERLWYAQKSIECGWSRSMLEMWIESSLYNRQGKAVTNFNKTLPIVQSDMAQQTLKDPYIFDFLTLHENALEKDLEQGLIDHIQKFLLELGEGFAFVGRQFHIEVGNADYYIDLLFYHLKLRCYVVIELKNTEFKPEYAGKLNFYLSAIDDMLRHKTDKPTIGLLLCKTKDNFTVEYALRDIGKPMGIAKYETMLVESLPKDYRGSLPTVEEIESELKKRSINININKKLNKRI